MAPTSLDDDIAAVLAGDRERFRAVIERCEGEVRLVVAAILPDRDQVDDVAQEAFLLAYRKLAEYRPGSDVAAWIKAIARNLALNQRRAWLRERAAHGEYRDHLERELDQRVVADSQRQDPAQSAIDDCLGRLGEAARAVIDAHYWRDETAADIAANQARSPEWVRVVLFRARAALADCLRAKGVSGGT